MAHTPQKTTTQSATAQSSADRWNEIAATDAFRNLVRAKMRFIVPATVFFIVYYFALPVLVGYFPHIMERRVIGSVNLAYLFALSQFFMAWIIMWMYIRAARRFDAMEHEIVEKLRTTHGSPKLHSGSNAR